VAVGAGAGRVAGVVGVQEVDAADDREHPVDGAGELLSRGVGVTGVEAEADLHVRLVIVDRLPQPGEGVEAPGDGVVAPGGVLDVERHLGLEHLDAPAPAPEPGRDAVLGVAWMDDHRGGADIRRGVAGLLEDLSRPVADVVPGRAHVDEIGSVDVQGYRRGPQLLRVVARRRLPPPLRIGQEDLYAIGAQGLGLVERVGGGDVSAHGELRGHHAASIVTL
jgi:hypothetical protein